MRRTYKSKKDAPGAIDPRDVMLMDSKASSVFDAFYIQNLKQTKREMSVGSAFQFAASNKVRKRKYVKRLKEQEPSLRESTSRSVFLTPDKSFRVNKAPDLFDQLLNSSLVDVNSLQKQITSKQQPKPERKGRNRQNYNKQNYSSSDSSGSNKENISNDNITKNSSDIKSHELIIEKKNCVKPIDQSINNIFNNLSLFNNQSKHENSVFNTSNAGCHKIANSPLCSTPFNKKYRGESIYKFSPISINFEDSPKCFNIDEENDSNDIDAKKNTDHDTSNTVRKSIILHIPNKRVRSRKLCAKDKIISFHQDLQENTITFDTTKKDSISHLSINTANVSGQKGNEIDSKDEVFNCLTLEDFKFKESQQILSATLDSSQNTVVTGVTNIDTCKDSCNVSLDYSLEDFPSKPFLGFTKVETENNVSTYSEVSSKNSTSNFIEDEDSESLYDTCGSDEIVDSLDIKQPIVLVNRLNDSIFNKYLNIDRDTDNSVSPNSTANSDSSNYSNDYTSNEEREDTISHNSINVSLEGNDLQSEKCLNNETLLAESQIQDHHDNLFKKEDICVSFVTTRRKNEITNDSFIIIDNFNDFNDSFNDIICKSNGIREIEAKQDTRTSEVSDSESEPNVTMVGSCQNTNKEELLGDYVNLDNVKDKILLLPHFIGNTQEATKDVSHNLNTRKSKLIDSQNNESLENDNYSRTTTSRISTRSTNKRQTEMQYDDINQYSIGEKSPCKTIDNVGEARENKHSIILKPGKKWERSLSIYRRMTSMTNHFDSSVLDDEHLENKGRNYRQSVISTMEMQDFPGPDHNVSINSRRSTFVSKPIRSTIKIIKELNSSNISICSTASEDIDGFLTEDCDDTVIELSKLSIADYEPEVTIVEKFHDTSNRREAARDYVLRRCNQSDAILFDECYPDTVLKNCRKIGEGVYGEVFLWRAGDGRARVLKIIPIAGSIKVNGEDQKDYDEIISEIVIAMELSALRTPITEIEQHLDEGKSIETLDLHSVGNATDVFNEVIAVRCVYGTYPARLLDLWELYDESRGSENDSPAILPPSQHFLVLELANAGQDLEGFHFTNAEQAYSVFRQVAFGLAVGEEAFQFEHRDLHWGNILISPTDQKCAWFVVGGRARAVARRGVAATVIDYSLSRAGPPRAALFADLAADDALFDAAGDYQFEVYRLMRDKLANEWKNFEPYTNILWLHYTADKMITALRYTRTNTKVHKHYIAKLKGIKDRVLSYDSALQLVLTDNEL